jgi:GDP-4-dehydro-6-deoxy-D-mannose reductase
VRILITGVAGFVGRHLAVAVSRRKGVELYGLCRSVPKNLLPKKVRNLDGDVRDSKRLTAILKRIRPHRIFHLAGSASVSQSWQKPELTFQNNVDGTRSLFEAVKQACPQARVLVTSSAEVYGSCPKKSQRLKESSPLRPMNPYAVSKIAQEFTALQYFLNFGFWVVRTRAFNHIGPGQSDAYVASNFAKQIAEIESGKIKPFLEVGNLEAIRDFTDVRDVVEAYWECLEKGVPGEAYNVACGHGRKVAEMLQYYLRQSVVTINVNQNLKRFRTADAPALVGSSAKIRQQTGWCPKYSLEETLLDILNDWRKKTA